jgi:CxC5 like cysteine cluster associated with KDZ transposases
MSDLSAILKALEQHPILKSLSISQLLEFLTRASALKRHIILAQPAEEPTGTAPLILPPVIREFLAKATGIALQAVQDAWDILKDCAWAMHPLAECVAKEKEAFSKFGWTHGLSEFVLPYFWDRADHPPEALLTLFPPTDCCENPKCDRTTELKREDARQVLVYTINGAQPAYSIHLTCDSMCTSLRNVKINRLAFRVQA